MFSCPLRSSNVALGQSNQANSNTLNTPWKEMGYCRNVIEELVIEETRAQIAKLAPGMRKQVNLSEAIAYSLNRLPPLYATTQNGWTQQLKRARSEMSTQVRNVVARALVSVQPDPLRTTDPLPETELEGQARSLARLQQILDKPDLKWKDVPKTLAAAMSNVRIKPSTGTSSIGASRLGAVDVKAYLQRSKTRASRSGVNIKESELEAKDFAAYMAGAAYGYSNILEKLVASIAVRQMARLSSELAERIPMEEVVAYTLNRLPPMYATSNRGYNALHAKAKVELSSQIISTMRDGLMKVGQTPYQAIPSLPFDKFRHEQDLALLEVQQLLNRDDITWHNVVDVVTQALEI
jgi:Late competence development protein ComFB